MDKGKKLFYGWWMVVVITIIFFTGGAAPFAIVLKQLMEQFHTGRGEVSLCQSIFMVAMGFTGIFVGWWVQRHSPKKFILWGTLVGGLTSLLLSTTNNIWYFYVFYFIAKPRPLMRLAILKK